MSNAQAADLIEKATHWWSTAIIDIEPGKIASAAIRSRS